MTLNRDVFLKDLEHERIPNGGVAKVTVPATPEEWNVLDYELKSFVCDGKYREGLERILHTFLANLSASNQPAAWVSGFYGSGKSHFARVLQYLWQNPTMPDGRQARDLVTLPAEIHHQLVELDTRARQHGGVWAAAGVLGSAADTASVRLALLTVLFAAAGLPEDYPAARLAIHLKQTGRFDAVRHRVEAQRGAGSLHHELRNMFVSPVLHQALLDEDVLQAPSAADVGKLLAIQYRRDDIDETEMLDTLRDVLALQARPDSHGKPPLTLIVLDELQQYIGDDQHRAFSVQPVVEACCSRFQNQLLFVATGQQVMQGTPQLQRLTARFTTQVALGDADVDKVVRTVVLAKKPEYKPALNSVLTHAQGEIARHLVGTALAPTNADLADLEADYPLLPTRRRFWEHVLRAVDTSGISANLRNQLQVVHDATARVFPEQLGRVIPADALYDRSVERMVQTGALPRETRIAIDGLRDGTPAGALCARACALVFLIGKLPVEAGDHGVRATAAVLADLLVDDLNASSAPLRQQLPDLLAGLVKDGALMELAGGVFRIQTREGSEWESDFQTRRTHLRNNEQQIESGRHAALEAALHKALGTLRQTQGRAKAPRTAKLHYSLAAPSPADPLSIWVRDEWNASLTHVLESARDGRGTAADDPTIYLFLPREHADALRDALCTYAAARECLDQRGVPATAAGIEAKAAMETRRVQAQHDLDRLLDGVLAGARVFQGGGSEVSDGPTLRDKIDTAFAASLVRLFPNFQTADDDRWTKVADRARAGGSEPLKLVDHNGPPETHPVCSELLRQIGNESRSGGELRKTLADVPFGWPQDAVDGALFALLAAGVLVATQSGSPVAVKDLAPAKLPQTQFRRERFVLSTSQNTALRGLLQQAGLPSQPGQEAAGVTRLLADLRTLAFDAGGNPPLPPPPLVDAIDALQALAGNEQLVAVDEGRDALLTLRQQWEQRRALRDARLPRWHALQQLLAYAADLPAADDVRQQATAIADQRTLLDQPDPTTPLLQQLNELLRAALRQAVERAQTAQRNAVAALVAAPAWSALDEAQRTAILAANGLAALSPPPIATEAHLIAALGARSLEGWSNLAAALATHANQAIDQATRLATPEAVAVTLTRTILTDAAALERYITTLRAEAGPALAAGKPVQLR